MSAPASRRLDAATEDHHSCVDVRNQSNLFQTCRHRVSSDTLGYLTLGCHQRQRQIIIADVDSTLSVETLLVDGQHFTIFFSMFAMASSFAFLASLWPCLECEVCRSVLMNFSSIVSFFCASLGPWCILLRLATSHPSQLARVRIFLQSQRKIQLCGPCLVDHAGLMLSRHHSLFLESLPAGCTRGYASCVHRESSVSPQQALPRPVVLLTTRTSTCCGRTAGAPAPLTPLPRAVRAGRCVQSSTALVVVLQNNFMSLVLTNTAPTQHPSSCSSHVRSSSTMFVHCRISPGFS